MKPTNLKLKQLKELIKERKEYLDTIERDILEVTTAGNNQLLMIHGELQVLENEKADLLKQNYALEQYIRENQLLADS